MITCIVLNYLDSSHQRIEVVEERVWLDISVYSFEVKEVIFETVEQGQHQIAYTVQEVSETKKETETSEKRKLQEIIQ